MDVTQKSEFGYHAATLRELNQILNNSDIHSVLRFLNKRTPHRYTGINRFDGPMLRNMALYDAQNPSIRKGDDAPIEVSYCSLLKETDSMEILDAEKDERVNGIITNTFAAYCGVLIRDLDGKPYGGLCHYDMNRCQQRSSDIPLLEAAAKLLYAKLLVEQSIN